MRAILNLTLLSIAAHTAHAAPAVLLDEDFASYRAGMLTRVVGAHTEYHYLPDAAPIGHWSVTSFRSIDASQRAWRIIEFNGKRALHQTYTNRMKHTHAMLAAGDPLWTDYTLEASFAPESRESQSGVIVRYHNDRCYYFFGVIEQRAILKKVDHEIAFQVPNEIVLAEAPFTWKTGDVLEARVDVAGSTIAATFAGGPELRAEDATFPQGGIALMSDIPTVYTRVRVTTTRKTARATAEAIAAREAEEQALQDANPKPALWKQVDLKDFGAARNLRFGDLDGDGRIDILSGQIRHHGPKDRNSEISCLTAITLDGKRLWQIGQPDTWKTDLTNDVAFQIHDLDGDGKTEVVYCQDQEIRVVDGATGVLKQKTPTPKSPPNSKPGYNTFDRILGDSLLFCDVRGTGHDRDILLKDRYQSVWVFDDQLNLLWHKQCNTGHYPFPHDIDNDGRDEIIVGYTLFDDNGDRLWTLEDKIQDHADGVAILAFKPGDGLRLLCAASDEGMFFANMKGEILKHHRVGHVQNPAVADFRPDLPGLEAVSINFWGNQGIIHLYDAGGNIYHDFEPCNHGSMMLPVNWTGQPGEYFLLSANVEQGGMFDGWGRRTVRFPADGHPDMCTAVLDITGDPRDEIVVWDPYELWIYTQDDNPKPGKLYQPQRNPLYNYSNYQATVSLPAWPEQAKR